MVAAACVRFVYQTKLADKMAAKGLQSTLAMAAVLPGSALLLYLVMLSCGFDPGWSIALATKWCKKAAWIYLDTTPFYAMIR